MIAGDASSVVRCLLDQLSDFVLARNAVIHKMAYTRKLFDQRQGTHTSYTDRTCARSTVPIDEQTY